MVNCGDKTANVLERHSAPNKLDAAILILDQSVSNDVVQLSAEPHCSNGDKLDFYGWGLVEHSWDNYPARLQHMKVTVQSGCSGNGLWLETYDSGKQTCGVSAE